MFCYFSAYATETAIWTTNSVLQIDYKRLQMTIYLLLTYDLGIFVNVEYKIYIMVGYIMFYASGKLMFLDLKTSVIYRV